MARGVLRTSDFFAAATAADKKNPFETSFRNRLLSAQQSMPKGPHTSGGRGVVFQSLDQDNRSFRFGSSLQTNSARLEDNLPPPTMWNTPELNKFHHHANPLLHTHVLSPPLLPENSSQKWSQSEPQRQMTIPKPHITVPVSHPDESYIQYNSVEHQHPTQQVQPREGVLSKKSTPIRKWKHTSSSGNDATRLSKRSRKPTPKSEGTEQSFNLANPRIIEAEKRSKFLARNRAAASKCRQKKKEWTSSLEAHARDLQNNKAQLEMVIGLLRDEILFLKCEVLKQTSCSCPCRQVRDLFGQGSDNMAHPKNQDYHPFGSAPSPVSAAAPNNNPPGGSFISCCPSEDRLEDTS